MKTVAFKMTFFRHGEDTWEPKLTGYKFPVPPGRVLINIKMTKVPRSHIKIKRAKLCERDTFQVVLGKRDRFLRVTANSYGDEINHVFQLR